MVFGKTYICFDALKRGWLAGCRPVIGLDGCYVKDFCSGQLSCAVGRDGKNHMFPIAWAVVQSESNETWAWFLKLLNEDIGFDDGHGLTFISDQQKVPQIPSKKVASEIPTPEFVIVDTYERDYSRTFNQPTSYLRARGARAEIGEFVEYDLDNEDEDWLQEFNRERNVLAAEKLETILFKLEVLDHKARERAGVITPTLGSPIPVLLTFDAAVEALQALSIKYGVFQSIYSYWKEKREKWQKPVLRRLQMQRRENNVQSFEKLRQVRRNLDQAKNLLEALIKREEKKRDVMDSEVSLQRMQMKYKHETELLEDSLALPTLPSFQSKFILSEDEYIDSDDVSNTRLNYRLMVPNPSFVDPRLAMHPAGSIKREFRRRPVSLTWLQKLDPSEPVLMFTKPLIPEKLAASGIVPPADTVVQNSTSSRLFNIRGRIGRGGRIVFDRWNPLMHTPLDCGDSLFIPPPKPIYAYDT